MARFKITGADGNTYEVEAGDDADPAALKQELDSAIAMEATKGSDASFNAAAEQPIVAGAEAEYGIDFDAPVKEVRAKIAQLPSNQRRAATKMWAQLRQTKAREGNKKSILGTFATIADDTARRVPRGLGLGPWANRLNAYTDGLTSDAPFDERLAMQEARDWVTDEDTDLNPEVAGGVHVGGLQKIGGAIGGAAAFPFINAFKGGNAATPTIAVGPRAVGQSLTQGSLPQRMANSAITGTVIGAGLGAGQGHSANERVMNALTQGVAGGAMGFGMPALAGAAGWGGAQARGLVDRMRGVNQQQQQGPLAGVNRITRDRLMEDALYSNALNNPGRQPLNHNQMLLNAGLGFTGRAQGIVRSGKGGAGAQQINQALDDQRTQLSPWIEQQFNRSLGPMPQGGAQHSANQARQAANRAAEPFYRQAENVRLPDTPSIQALRNRIPQNIQQQIMAEAQAEGRRIDWRNPAFLESAQRTLGGIVQQAQGGANPNHNIARVYGGLQQDIRNYLDRAMRQATPPPIPGSRQPPPINPLEAARATARPGQQQVAGANAGERMFQGQQPNPDVLRNTIQREGAGYLQGMREAARENAGAILGSTVNRGPGQLGDKVLSSWGRQNLETIANPQAARQLTDAMEIAGGIRMNEAAIRGNSVTAQALQNIEKNRAPTMPSGGLKGIVNKAVDWVTERMSGTYMQGREGALNQEMGQLLTLRGPAAERVLQELQRLHNAAQNNPARQDAIRRVMQLVGRGGVVGTGAQVQEQMAPRFRGTYN